MTNPDYKAAYERQKKAREYADKLLEDKSRELHEATSTLTTAYNRLRFQKAQLLHQEKLASMGQLSAGVAHEINNPSAYVRSNLNTLKKYKSDINGFIETVIALDKDPEITSVIADAYKNYDIAFLMDDFNDIISDSISGMERISEIVRSLKDFSRPDTDEKKPFDVNESIRSTLKLVWNELKYKGDIVEQYGDLPAIDGYAGGFSQVILNLLVNAAQAIESKGTISIVTSVEKGLLYVKISDTGKGISPMDIDRIFDPFFSTKAPGKGTGLGLSISHGIITKHGGELSVTSNAERGTTFTIAIPVTTE
jgi:Signal transduction histidine kinase regulating C4-dicarboxylate transport system